ncbi:MAG TPA: hypothetical protein PLV92_21625, partial [Pirellulaceae bacterium]|nr:hypothetical protein [Pirellulaceae bacterium]
MNRWFKSSLVVLVWAILAGNAKADGERLGDWAYLAEVAPGAASANPPAKPSSITPGEGRASWSSDRWSYLLAPGEVAASERGAATVTIDEPSKRQDF